ncbi:MAG: menaquinone biosynthesis decarboxylase, partial [Calditrichaeota bacterium]|nr:menaquinone biosynthesis decarboxylase [Calditrichota bacterium]
FLNIEMPTGFGQMLTKVKELSAVRKFLPKHVKQAACQEIVYTGDEIDLNRFPILKTWPDDAGPFITLPLVFTKSLDGKAKNCGMYRMQVYDQRTTGMHWQIHHDGSNFFSEYRKAGKRMEVAVAIGADPSLAFAAIAPLPPKIFEVLIAGFIRNKPVEMVKCKTVDIEVPAEAEIILEGYVEPDELQSEGPFGDHTGYYTLEEDYPVFHLTAITTRKNPVYWTTVVGRSPQEDCYFGGKATERIFLPMFRTIAHEVTDMLLPWDGCFHNCMILSMKKQFPLHARRLMSQIWGTGQASTCKAIITVDEDVKLSDSEEMLLYILERLDIRHSVYLNEGIVDALDHSSYQWAYGGKIGLDITTALAGEPHQNDPVTNRTNPVNELEIFEAISKIHSSVLAVRPYAEQSKNPVLIVKVEKKEGRLAQQISAKIFQSENFNHFNIFFFVDEKNNLDDGHQLIWRLTNNTDWNKDTYFSPDRDRLAIDSTSKIAADGFQRRWPNDLIMSDEIIKRVDEKSKRISGLNQ